MTVERMAPHDWVAVRRIYEEGIATGDATFEPAPPDWTEFDESHLSTPRLVVRDGGEVVAWAALRPYSRRRAYRGVAEVSIYVAERARGRGIGRILLRELIGASEAAGIWTLQAGIFPENAASVALHVSQGFRVVGRRERIGQRDGVWRDVLLLERRSGRV